MSRFSLPLALAASSVALLASCTTLVSSGPTRPTGSGEAPLFGAGGTRPTIGGRESRNSQASAASNSTSTSGVSTASTPPVRGSSGGEGTVTTSSSTSTTTTSGSGGTSGTTGSVASTPPKPETEERYGRPVPGRNDIIVNPFDPNGPPLKIKNLSSGRADYTSGDRLRNPNDPNQHIIVP